MTDCPQLVYTSAGRTLEGPGFGVLLMSADWPPSLGTSRSTLGPLIGQPADGAAHGLLTCGGGRLAYAKVALAADDFGRSGNYVVHLLWDATGVLTPRERALRRRSRRRTGEAEVALPAHLDLRRDRGPARCAALHQGGDQTFPLVRAAQRSGAQSR